MVLSADKAVKLSAHAKFILITSTVSAILLAFTLPNLLLVKVSSSINSTRRLQKRRDRSAIVALVPNTPNDPSDFCLALQSLESLSATDTKMKQAPVFAFNEGNIPPEVKYMIMSCTDRPVYFPEVEFDYPSGFDPEKELSGKMTQQVAKGGSNMGRPLFGYAQMIRFWTSKVWKQPALQDYDTIMRIDTDSCFINGGDDPEDLDLPGISEQYVYRSKGPGTGIPVWIDGLYEFTIDYMKKERITPSNPQLWNVIEQTWEEDKTLRTLGTNFEVSRMSFFNRPDVAKWLDALTEQKPFGVFRYRWGDAQTRVLTLAMFGTEENTLLRKHPGYVHGREVIKKGVVGKSLCSRYFDENGRIGSEVKDVVRFSG